MTIGAGEFISLVVLAVTAIAWLVRLEASTRQNAKDVTGVAKSIREQMACLRTDTRLQRSEDLGRIEKTLDDIKHSIQRLADGATR